MKHYHIAVETGPKRKKTMVHVTDLLGCIAQGPTTDDAIAATPAAIRRYLEFLHDHGERVDPQAEFTCIVAEEWTGGGFIGTAPLAFDNAPLETRELNLYVKRAGWIHENLLDQIRDLSPEQMNQEPARGRTLARIVEHVVESEAAYLRSNVGPVEDLAEALKAFRAGPADLPAALERIWRIETARLKKMTDTERTRTVMGGAVVKSARRCLRRTLEHAWEHLEEIKERLA